jgi:WD40 repeat protein
VAFSPDGKTLAVGTTDVVNRVNYSKNKTFLWNVATKRVIATLTSPVYKINPLSINDTSGGDSLAFSPDGKTLAIPEFGGKTYLWNVATRRVIAILTNPVGTGVSSVAFSPDGKTLATGDQDGRIYLWNVATRRLALTLTDRGGTGVDSVAFSPDGKTLAVGDGDGKTYLWRNS